MLCPPHVQEITHFLSVTPCDSLPLTRLEGLKELTRQLHDNKGQIRELLKECHGVEGEKLLCHSVTVFCASSKYGLSLL